MRSTALPPQCWQTRIEEPPNFFSGAQASQSGRPEVWHLKNAILSVWVRQQAGCSDCCSFARAKSYLR